MHRLPHHRPLPRSALGCPLPTTARGGRAVRAATSKHSNSPKGETSRSSARFACLLARLLDLSLVSPSPFAPPFVCVRRDVGVVSQLLSLTSPDQSPILSSSLFNPLAHQGSPQEGEKPAASPIHALSARLPCIQSHWSCIRAASQVVDAPPSTTSPKPLPKKHHRH